MVFNVHRMASLQAVDEWMTAMSVYISSTDIPFVLLAHKADLIQERIMSSDDLDAYAKVKERYNITFMYEKYLEFY